MSVRAVVGKLPQFWGYGVGMPEAQDMQVFDEAALAVVLEQYLPGSDAATGLQAEVLNSAAWPLAPGT